MSVNAAIEAELPFLCAEANARMTDTCHITRPGDPADATTDPTTGEYVEPIPVTVYEGPCRIPKRDAASSEAASGDASWQVSEFPLSLPVGADPRIVAGASHLVRVGHTVTYLTSAHDPALVGNVYGITAEPDQSVATARRFRMKRITGS